MVTKKRQVNEELKKTVEEFTNPMATAVMEPETSTINSSDAIQSVSLHYGGDRVSKLTITLTGQKPSFEFDGVWSGGNMKVVARHLNRAYAKYRLQMRREGIATFNQGGTENA